MWYAMWVKTGQEEKVQKLCGKMLSEAAVCEQCFLLRYERARKLNGRWTRQKELLFPGYLFVVSENVNELVRKLKEIPEFTRVLGDSEEPIPLRQEEIRFLQKYTNEERVLEMSKGYLAGDRLVVTEGPLKDYQGKVIHVDRHKRIVTLEMEFFGRTMRMKVGMEVVEKRLDL